MLRIPNETWITIPKIMHIYMYIYIYISKRYLTKNICNTSLWYCIAPRKYLVRINLGGVQPMASMHRTSNQFPYYIRRHRQSSYLLGSFFIARMPRFKRARETYQYISSSILTWRWWGLVEWMTLRAAYVTPLCICPCSWWLWLTSNSSPSFNKQNQTKPTGITIREQRLHMLIKNVFDASFSSLFTRQFRNVSIKLPGTYPNLINICVL